MGKITVSRSTYNRIKNFGTEKDPEYNPEEPTWDDYVYGSDAIKRRSTYLKNFRSNIINNGTAENVTGNISGNEQTNADDYRREMQGFMRYLETASKRAMTDGDTDTFSAISNARNDFGIDSSMDEYEENDYLNNAVDRVRSLSAQRKTQNSDYLGVSTPRGLDFHYANAFGQSDRSSSLQELGSKKSGTTSKTGTALDIASKTVSNKTDESAMRSSANNYAQLDPALANEALMGFYATTPQGYGTGTLYSQESLKRLKELANQAVTSNSENGGSIAKQRQQALEDEAQQREAWFNERRQKYQHITQNADFEQNIDGWEDVGKASDPLMTDAALGYELTVPLENRDTDTQNTYKQQEADSAYNVSRMSPTERKIYRYLENTEGKDSAEEYMEYLSYRLNARNMNEVRAAADSGTDTTAGKIVHSALSVPANLAGGALGTADYAIQTIRNKLGNYRPIDYNSDGQVIGEYANAVRENTQEDFGNVGKFLYGTAMSMADSVASMLTAGEAGGALLGLSAGRQGVQDAVEAGATESQAMAMGLFNGAAEMIFENIGIDNLYSILQNSGTRTFKAAARTVLGQVLAEGTEEVGTTIANTLGDAVIMADKSEINRQISEYMNAGATQEQATRAALLNWVENLGIDFLGGAVSGGVLGAGGVAISNVQNYSDLGEAFRTGIAWYDTPSAQDTVSEVINAPEFYSNVTVDVARMIDAHGFENTPDYVLGRFYHLFTRDVMKSNLSGVTPLGYDVTYKNKMVPYRTASDATEQTATQAANENDSPIVRNESGAVDVQRTLLNAARQSAMLETARENQMRALSGYISMPQQSTSVNDAAQRLISEYGNRTQQVSPANAVNAVSAANTANTVSEQNVPQVASVSAQNNTRIGSQNTSSTAQNTAIPTQSAAQDDLTASGGEPSAPAPAAKTSQAANTATQSGTTKKRKKFKVTKASLNKFGKGMRIVKLNYGGNTYVTSGSLVLLADDVANDERVIRADDFQGDSNKLVAHYVEGETTPVTTDDFITITVGNSEGNAAINVNGKYHIFDVKLLSTLTDAPNLYLNESLEWPVLIARDENGKLLGFLFPKTNKDQNGIAHDVQETEKLQRQIEEEALAYSERARLAFIDGYKKLRKSGVSLEAYAAAFKSAYDAGKAGIDYKTFLEHQGYAEILDQSTRSVAYAAGMNAAHKAHVSEQAAKPVEESAPAKKPAEKPAKKPQAEEKIAPKPAEEVTAKDTAEEGTEVSANKGETSQVLAGRLIPLLKKGTTFSSSFLFELADKAFGGTQAQGVYSPKDAYDAMELAVNEYLLDFARDFNGSVKDAVRAINKLQNMLDKIPTQTKRTAEQESFQQFSTPPTIAYLAAWAADISEADTVLEPSAGIGGLAVYPKAWGARTVVNELSERRLAVLENMGFDLTFNENAEQINNVLPDDVHPSVVLMNPPFSATAGRMQSNKTSYATRHIEQALLRLNDGGRLVAILGRGMSNDAASFRKWWSEIKGKYNVRANISIDGKNYRKYGTSFDVQLVVIDKTGPQEGTTLTGVYTDLKEIPKALEAIRNDRSEGIVRESGNGTEHGADAHAPVGGRTGSSNVGGSGRAGGTASVSDGGRTDVAVDGAGGRDVDVAGASGGSAQGVRQAGAKPANGGRGGRVHDGVSGKRGNGNLGSGNIRSDAEPALPGLTDSSVKSLRDLKPAKPTTKVNNRGAVKDNGVFAQYVPAPLPVAGTKAHPAKLVESAAMSAVPAPKATYVPDLPAELITSGAISDVQLESIVYAGQAHSQMLPNGQRRGFFIGDGTGVGKGRQIAAIIADNMRQGRKKAVWVSKNTGLYSDAQRDWTDIGGNASDFINNKKGDFPKRPNQWARDEGILFLTYGGMTSSSKGQNAIANIERVIEWLGEDFDGVIAFDEAHEMGNAMGKKGKFGNTKPSNKALRGIELQERLPKARVIYVSATGATEVSNLAYAPRLGLWGSGTSFNNVREFVDEIGSSGLAAMELVARDMKSSGSYLARSISYDDVKYETLERKLSRTQRTIYDTMSEAWQVVLQNVNEALKVTGQGNNGRLRGNATSAFYNYLQNFYNQVLTSMAMPSVVEDIQKQLDDGKSVVLQIVNTNEAQQERAVKQAQEEGLSLEDMDMTPREMLVQYLVKCFPTQVYEPYTDENGNEQMRPATDRDGNPVEDKQAVAMRNELINKVNDMSVPESALDILLNAFGTENVAEVTGRSSRVVYKQDGHGNTVRVEERRTSSASAADTAAFQNGEKRILVFSQAGGTGKSYHADLRAKNQQQRVHYLIQPGWEAAKAMQGFGRTHRSNQASAPIFKLVTTDVKGHKRFISTIARRLAQLGALTKGQRDSGNAMFNEKDNLESPLAIRALQTFYDLLGNDQIAGLDGRAVITHLGLASKFFDENGKYKQNAEVASDMSKFLNRILALKIDEQNRVFDAFMTIYDAAFDAAVANGTLDMGMETVKADSIEIIDDSVVRRDENTGAETHYVQANVKNKPRVIDYKYLKDMRNDFVGLYRLNETGEVRAVYRVADITNARTGEVQKQYLMQTAVYGKFNKVVESRFNDRLTEIPKAQWQAAWKEAQAAAPEYVESTYHMLAGTLLPIWSDLPQDNHVKVVRLTADDGRTYLGRIIDSSRIDAVLSKLGSVQRTKQTYNGVDVFRRVMNGDKARLLYNSWVLIRSRVAGEQRIEITGKNLFSATDYDGVFAEKINYITRYFIPTDAKKGAQVIEQIIKRNPVLDVSNSDNSDDVAFSTRAGGTVQGNTSAANNAKKGEALNLSEIVERLRHDFGVHITIGHVTHAKALGQYNEVNNGIRARIYNDLPTISHEIGHHLDNRFGILDRADANTQHELLKCAGSQTRSTPKQTMAEGVAEFVRMYLENRETTAIDYPGIYNLVLSSVDENTVNLLNAFADEINAYYVRTAGAATSYVVPMDKGKADARTFGEKLTDKGHRAYQDYVDALHGIKLFSDRYGGRAYTLARNSAYADAVAANAIRADQLRDLNGNVVGEGLRKALRGVKLGNKQEYADFNEYLIVRHGPERLKEGKRVFADNRHNSSIWMMNRQAELEAQYPEFEATADRLYEYERNVLYTFGVQTGLVSNEAYEQWGERWQFYVPFNRQMDTQTNNGVKRGFANQNSTIRRARGSGRNIINPVESIFANTAKMITVAMHNNVMIEIVKIVRENPNDMTANWIEQVADDSRRQVDNITSVKQKIAQAAMNEFTDADDLDTLFGILKGIDNILIEYTRSGKSRDDRVVTVLEGGEKTFWRVNDDLLFDSLVNMAPQRVPSVLRTLTNVNRLITSNLTGANVIWSIFSNAPRDFMTALAYSKDRNVIHMVSNIGKSYLESIRGIRHVDKQSPMYQEFLAMGGGMDSVYSSDSNIGNMGRRMITGKPKNAWEWVQTPLDMIEWLSNTIEAGPRYAEYVARRNAGESPAEAIMAAHDVTVDFRRGGAKSRTINQIVPFFNANVQGTDKLVRFLYADDIKPSKRRNAEKIRAGVYLGVCAALGALITAINHGTEEKERDYATLSTYTKNNYFCIPLGDSKYLTIPKPRELAVPMSFTSAALEYAWNENENAFDDFAEYTIDMVAPPIADDLGSAVWKLFADGSEAAGEEAANALGDLGLLGVIHYLSANKDFLGRPIVSTSLENVEAKDQYTARTSKLAYALGQAFNMSPVKIDYFFQNTLGGWWKNQKALFPMDSSNIDTSLGIASTWVRDSLYSTDIVNTMYDNATAASRAADSDPEDGTEAAWKQQCNQMKQFYSNFYGLTKNTDGEQTRIARRTVIDMISDFNSLYDSGNESTQQTAVYDIIRATCDASILPSTMPTSIKYGEKNDKVLELSPDAYVEYQTEYNSLYWERAVLLATRYANHPEAAAEKIEDMKKEVKEEATKAVLRRALKG